MSAGKDWLALLTATDAPALPAPWVMQLGLAMGWALVLALLGAALTRRFSLPTRRFTALVFLIWTMAPGPVSPDYWLGLAFHAPSLLAMLLCGWGLKRLLLPTSSSTLSPATSAGVRETGAVDSLYVFLWPLVALGYLLLLDTFAVLPLQIYAWGFSPMLLIGLLGLSTLPWLLRDHAVDSQGSRLLIAPTALLLFSVTRLPTGNLWDALMDPWLWLFLQWLLVCSLYRRLRMPTSPVTTRG
jgi:hypothetical protein